MLEISPGVFVGTLTARVRILVWVRVVEMVRTGRAIMVNSANNEQRLEFKVHAHHWQPVDFEGIQLILRPNGNEPTSEPERATGWSTASRRRFLGR